MGHVIWTTGNRRRIGEEEEDEVEEQENGEGGEREREIQEICSREELMETAGNRCSQKPFQFGPQMKGGGRISLLALFRQLLTPSLQRRPNRMSGLQSQPRRALLVGSNGAA